MRSPPTSRPDRSGGKRTRRRRQVPSVGRASVGVDGRTLGGRRPPIGPPCRSTCQPSQSLVTRTRAAARTAVVFPNLRGSLRIDSRKKVIVTTVPILRDVGAAFAHHDSQRAILPLVQENALPHL